VEDFVGEDFLGGQKKMIVRGKGRVARADRPLLEREEGGELFKKESIILGEFFYDKIGGG